jgi:hypothetical protein
MSSNPSNLICSKRKFEQQLPVFLVSSFSLSLSSPLTFRTLVLALVVALFPSSGRPSQSHLRCERFPPKTCFVPPSFYSRVLDQFSKAFGFFLHNNVSGMNSCENNLQLKASRSKQSQPVAHLPDIGWERSAVWAVGQQRSVTAIV